MSELAHITRCLDLGEADIAKAVASRESTRALLDHLSRIGKPSSGAPKLLLLLARLATTACDWLDGDLRIEIVGDEQVSVVEIMTELGGGTRERVFSAFVMQVPLSEFVRAVERVPHMIAPLGVKVQTARRIVLTATEQVRLTTMPPPMVKIADASLFSFATPNTPINIGPYPLNALRASVPPERAVPSDPPPDELASINSGWGASEPPPPVPLPSEIPQELRGAVMAPKPTK
jgi:hypothetical protein